MNRAILLAALAGVALGAPASAQQTQQPPAQPQQPAQPTPVEQMSVRELREAVTRLRGYVNNGATQAPPAALAGCTSPESRQMDFWLGEWLLSPTSAGANTVLGVNTITLHNQGCVIIETWRPFTGAHGMSINIYDPVTQHWHQTYAGAGGRRTAYEGAMDSDGVMRLNVVSPPPGPPPAPQGQQRMNFQRIDDNSLRQWGERLDPATNQWVVTFDLTYHRRVATPTQRQQ
jgi:hypothetical protein